MGKDKKDKKDKKAKKAAEEVAVAAPPVVEPVVEKPKKDKKDKKDKKAKKDKKREAEAPAIVEDTTPAPVEEASPAKKQKTETGAVVTSFGDDDDRKIFIGGCSDDITDDHVKGVFEGVESCRWVSDKMGKFKGFGFVTFESAEQAQAAASKENVEIAGRSCRVNMAGSKPAGGAGGAGGAAGANKFADDTRRVFIGRCPDSIDDTAVSAVFEGVESVKWITDRESGKFKGCGFITFVDDASAEKAAAKGQVEISGGTCTVRMAGDNSNRGTGGAGGFGGRDRNQGGGGRGGDKMADDARKIFIGGCPMEITDTDVTNTFDNVESVKWVTDRETGSFRGMGFILFNDEASAQAAASKESVTIHGKPCRVNMAGSKGGAGGGGGGAPARGGGGRSSDDDARKVFIGGCPQDIADGDVSGKFAGVESVRWLTDRETGQFKGAGFILFESSEAAQKAAEGGSVEIKGSNCRVSMAGDKPAGGGGRGAGRGGGRGRGGRGGPKVTLESQGQGSKVTFDD